jgi:lysophospholipase L1-like esterase
VKRRALLLAAVVYLPAALAAALVAAIAWDLHALRTLDTTRVAAELRAHLERTVPLSFPLPDGLAAADPSRRTVFVFGSSDVLLSDGRTFPDYLAERRRDLRVVNLGAIGIPSSFVRRRVEEALAVARPDLVVVYYGHNDYNSAYQGFVVPRYLQKFGLLARLAYLVRDRRAPTGVLEAGDFYWYSRLVTPRITKAFERLGLLELRAADFAPVNRVVLDGFVRNNEAILALAASRGVPVVLVTPVGNLRAEPYGDLTTTTALFERGIAAADYGEALAYLRQARDAEFLTYDLRAKSPLLEYLRSLGPPRAHVLDLERELERRRFGFGYGDFLDYVHLNDRTHALVAGLLADFLAAEGLVAPAAPGR